jgi:crotonobetainyl-CoA:carnitine CoA-transferase CaiB-like acyl-CoA transferase
VTEDSTNERRVDSPLQGVKVLEVAEYIAGPFAGQQLADFGAEVIKIERPGHGDPFRTYVGGKSISNYGVNFSAYNRNKKSIVLDLRNPAARDIVQRLACQVDVVLENFRSGVMDRLGIGYDILRESNPALIFCSISGFTDDGPYRDRPAFDTVGQALSGILYTFTDPERPNLRGPTLVDQATAMQATTAIIAALYARNMSKVGARIDISMVDASVGFIPDFHAFYTDAGVAMEPDTRAAVSHAFIMRCSDGGVVAFQLGGLERTWVGLGKAIGRTEIVKDPRFITREARVANWADLIELLRPIFLAQTRSYWEERLGGADVPYAAVLSIPEVHNDPEIKHSGLFEQYEHPVAGSMTMMRRVARINRSRGTAQAPPALLGEHTDLVMRSAGYDDDEVAAFRSAGVFGTTQGSKE